MRGGQAGPSPEENGSHADCGAVRVRPLLPANQRAQHDEKVRVMPGAAGDLVQSHRLDTHSHTHWTARC